MGEGGSVSDIGDSAERLDIQRRNQMRQLLVNELTKSTGSVKLAEYVVNRLTVHDTALLAEAAVTFAADDLKRLVAS